MGCTKEAKHKVAVMTSQGQLTLSICQEHYDSITIPPVAVSIGCKIQSVKCQDEPVRTPIKVENYTIALTEQTLKELLQAVEIGKKENKEEIVVSSSFEPRSYKIHLGDCESAGYQIKRD